MKRKKICIVIITIILFVLGITLLSLGISFLLNHNNNDNDNDDDDVSATYVKVQEDDYEKTIIKSSAANPIKKDGLEATNIEIQNYGSNLVINTTIKNHTKEKIDGFYIEIELLDKDGNAVTMIAENSKAVIEAGGEYLLENGAGTENGQNIVNARIRTLRKEHIGAK